jgi:D-glycero-alpha-D-manno-heptose 1-phosphate guanylyltransferase
MEAIILAGGLGTRLRSEVADRPKVMAEINRQPFLNYLLNYLAVHSIKRVLLATGYLHEFIANYYGDRYKHLHIDYSIEEQPLGTGGAIKQAMSKIEGEQVLILNGDTFFDINTDTLSLHHKEHEADITIALKAMRHISRYGIVKVKGTRIVSFEEKQEVEEGFINAGVYVAKKTLFQSIELPDKFSFEEDVLKKFTSELNMHAYISDAYFIDIGIPEDYQRAQTEMLEYE